ncbi:hypothetical protein BDZ45DRAFT_742477 [Acephala macrosclerotiorum]|nr:hypothetical protein BDZ45DRAFT_742477 [Acephala macrosclerotiorum]
MPVVLISRQLSSTTSAGIQISNSSINAFSAPALAVIAGDFVISNNNLLTNLSLPLLTSINGNFILWYTFGTINLSGDFSSVTLPDLRSILGGFHVNSSNTALDCTAFDKLAAQSS